MYVYNEQDKRLLQERVIQFRGQLDRYLAGRLSDEEFRPLRLMNGLYHQRHAYMLRVAIPYGLLSATQLRQLAMIARRYDKDFGHFTTRQNIQYNWPELADVPAILQALADVEMHAIQTSGNCIRNITSDPLAGVAADEIADPRPYCEIVRQWSTLHPEFSFLPRKFKIAITGATKDRTALLFHDIGLRLVQDTEQHPGFQVAVGGGQGRTPVIGSIIRDFLPREHLLSYLEAVLRVYNRLGRRDNIYKARIKILVRQTGVEAFREQVEAEWIQLKTQMKPLTEAEIDTMQAHFLPPDYLPQPAEIADQHSNPLFNDWLRRCVLAHKVAGYRIVTLSLKPPGTPPGDVTADQMDAIADLSERYSFGRIRTTYQQNLVFSDVPATALYDLWQALRRLNLATPNVDTLTDMICCPGLDYCSLANASSIPLAQAINERFDSLDYLYDLGDIRLNISGCVNACGHHHVGHIGILGVDKKGAEHYQILLGGEAGDNAALAENLGPSMPQDAVISAVEQVLQVYLEQRTTDESFVNTVHRIGTQPFKERVYGKRH